MMKRTVRLPYGYRATFSFMPPDELRIEWEPHIPRFQRERARRRFLEAYAAARDVFMQDLSSMRGESVLMLTVDDNRVIGAKPFHPERTQ